VGTAEDRIPPLDTIDILVEEIIDVGDTGPGSVSDWVGTAEDRISLLDTVDTLVGEIIDGCMPVEGGEIFELGGGVDRGGSFVDDEVIVGVDGIDVVCE
jgi:hypothetical protein